jgi:signal transduction histidine kinase
VSYADAPFERMRPGVWDLAFGEGGALWVATDEGVACLHGDMWLFFDHRTGLDCSHLWPVIPAAGRVHVGSRGGGVWTLDVARARTPSPRVSGVEVSRDARELIWHTHAWWGQARDEGTESRYRIDLGPWSEWTSRGRVRLSDLSHGEHVVGVQAKGRFGDLGREAVITFSVRPPIYQQPAFVAAVGGLSAALLLVVAVYWVRRRRHLRILRDSEARFRAQYRGFPMPTYSWRVAGDDLVLEEMNVAAEEAPAVTRSIGTLASVAYAGRADILDELHRCIHERTSFQREFRYRHAPDAEEQDLRVSFSFVPPDIAMVHAEDITTRKRAKRGLVQYARQLDALNEIIIAGTRARDVRTLCETVVDAVLELLGMEAAAVFLVDWERRVAVLEYERHLPTDMAAVATRVPIDKEPFRFVYVEQRSVFVDDYEEWDPGATERTGLNSFASVPVVSDGNAIGSVNMASRTPHSFSVREKKIFESVGRYLGTVIARIRIEAELDRQLDSTRAARAATEAANARLMAVSQRLVEVQEAERRRLSRELHDEVGQIVTGLKLALETASRGGAEEAASRLPVALRLTDDLLRSVRELSHSLRPSVLDDLGLVPALRWNLERFRSGSDLEVVFFERTEQEQRFPADVETAVYRIVQEALTNVVRHAEAGSVKVRLWTSTGSLFVQVEDDGRGFDADSALLSSASLGVGGMRERAALVGGTLSIDATHGAGTRVTAEIPLDGNGDPGGEA